MKKFLLFFLLFPFYLHAQMQLTSYNTGTSFACITVDTNNNIWAGRTNGVYLLNKAANPAASQFTSVSGTTNYNVQALVTDTKGNIWAGHNGLGGSTANGGGIERIPFNNPSAIQHYAADANAQGLTFVARDGLATRDCASLAVDTAGTVWSAHKYNDLTSPPNYIVTPGSVSFKPVASSVFFSKSTYQNVLSNTQPAELPYPAYTYNPTISQAPQTRNVYAVACGMNEVWISVAAYISKSLQSFPARILKYNLNGTYDTSFDFTAIGISAGGTFNGLYVSPAGDVWVTMTAGKGFAVRRNGIWKYVNTTNAQMSCIFPAGSGTSMSNNAIWGNKLGQVFIGTNNGLLVYRGVGPVDSSKSYTLYRASTHGLISNTILGGASEKDSIQWIATSNGIMRTTLGKNYPLSKDSISYTSCSQIFINGIEDVLNPILYPNVTSRQDYHSYWVETVICNTSGPNGQNCNAEYVYKLMMKDATLTSPTPFDFPYDIPSFPFLTGSNKDTVTKVIRQNVNAWNSSIGIIYISSVLNPAYALLNAGTQTNFPIEYLSRFLATYEQKHNNPDSVASCSIYALHNSPNFVRARTLYDISIDVWCGNQLTSPVYDNVWLFANPRNLTITNYTVPGHFLFPGRVVRTVIEECGTVKVITQGTGLSYCGNSSPGRWNAIGNIVVGSILFKNIDLRLKKAFQVAH